MSEVDLKGISEKLLEQVAREISARARSRAWRAAESRFPRISGGDRFEMQVADLRSRYREHIIPEMVDEEITSMVQRLFECKASEQEVL